MAAVFSASTGATKRVIPSSRALEQETEQLSSKALSLPGVGHDDRRLRLFWSRTHPARHSNGLAAGEIERDERLVSMMIDVGQVVELGVAQFRDRSEEAAPTRFDAEPHEALHEPRTIVGTYLTDRDA